VRTPLLALVVVLATGCVTYRLPPPTYAPVALASGVVIEDLVVPEKGEPIAVGERIALHYRLCLNNGREVDSSFDRALPLEVELGAGQLPRGLEEGVVGMRHNGRRRIVVPPDLGYGDAGLEPRVPPKSILVFEVELTSLETGDG